MSKFAKFESDYLKTDVCLVGGTNLPPTVMSVNFRNFEELYPRSLKTYHFQT